MGSVLRAYKPDEGETLNLNDLSRLRSDTISFRWFHSILNRAFLLACQAN